MDIEDFVKLNRDAFDEDPKEQVWRSLNEKIKPKPVFKIQRYFKVFAGAAVLAVSLGLAYYFGMKNASPAPAVYTSNAETEKVLLQFANSIAAKKAENQVLLSGQPQLEASFENDLKLLDDSYENLKTALASQANKKQILEALMENLKYQLEILNTQSKILKEQSEYESNKVI
jgi:CHASE3 domain sensor protein